MVKRFRATLSKIKAPGFKVFGLMELFTFGGTGLLSAGAWQIYPPAAFIVSGLIFFWLGTARDK